MLVNQKIVKLKLNVAACCFSMWWNFVKWNKWIHVCYWGCRWGFCRRWWRWWWWWWDYVHCINACREYYYIIIPATYYEKLHIYVSYHRYIKQCLNGQSKGLYIHKLKWIQHNIFDFNVLLLRLICYLARNVGHENIFYSNKEAISRRKSGAISVICIPIPTFVTPRTRV